MKRCISLNSKAFKDLAAKSGLNAMELESRMLEWMDMNNTDNYPTLSQLNIEEESIIKSGIEDIFSKNQEISKIGSQQQYSKYLDTIFPGSKVKDIVYHGTLDKFENFNKEQLGKNTNHDRPMGFYFTRKNIAENLYGSFADISSETGEKEMKKGNLIHAIINTDNKYEEIKEKSDISGYGDYVDYISHVVFNPEQIHILGSKEDITGFKKFVENNINKKNLQQSNILESEVHPDEVANEVLDENNTYLVDDNSRYENYDINQDEELTQNSDEI